jgi:hypothetical protein
MTDAGADNRRAARAKEKKSGRSKKPFIIWGVTAVVLIVIAGGAWVGVHAFQAKGELEEAQGLIGTLKDQATALDTAGATATYAEVSEHTAAARSLTDDLVWRTAEFVPFAGANLRAFREIAAVTDSVIVDVADPLVTVMGTIDPATLAPQNGAINPQLFIDATPAVAQANVGIKSAVAANAAIDTSATISQISEAHDTITELLDQVAPALDTADKVVPLLAPALGSEGPRKYVVMFQNNAEVRALGGAALSFAPVTVDNGAISLGETVSASVDTFTTRTSSIVPVPDGVSDTYPGYGQSIIDSTQRPSFTAAAQMAQAFWTELYGPIDGVISIDPVALSYILRATQPITMSTGDVLTPDSLVPILLNDVYLRFTGSDPKVLNAKQDAVFGEAVGATFAAITNGPLDVNELLGGLSQGYGENRLMYWSANEAEEAQMVAMGVNGELPVSDATTQRVGLYFQDAVGSKLNYYLNQSVHLSNASCRTDGLVNYRVSADLQSTLPTTGLSKLPFHITGEYLRNKVKIGVQRMEVRLYAPAGMQILGVKVNGVPVALPALHDESWSVGQVQIEVAPSAALNITYDMISQPGPTALEAQITPMVHPTTVDNSALDCTTVAAG